MRIFLLVVLALPFMAGCKVFSALGQAALEQPEVVARFAELEDKIGATRGSIEESVSALVDHDVNRAVRVVENNVTNQISKLEGENANMLIKASQIVTRAKEIVEEDRPVDVALRKSNVENSRPKPSDKHPAEGKLPLLGLLIPILGAMAGRRS